MNRILSRTVRFLLLLVAIAPCIQTQPIPPIVSGLPPIVGAQISPAQILSILDSACPSGHRVLIREGRKSYVCTYCPEGSNPVLEGDTATLGKLLEGHFTSPKGKELLVRFNGCGPAQRPGFSVLFQKSRQRWLRLWTDADTSLDQCHVFSRPGGRDLLLCLDGPRLRGFQFISLNQIELNKTGVQDRGELFSLLSNAARIIGGRCDLLTDSKAHAVWADLDNDGLLDLTITVVVWQGPGRFDQKHAACAPMPHLVPTSHKLQFLYRDGVFRPTEETKREVSELEKVWQKGSPDSN